MSPHEQSMLSWSAVHCRHACDVAALILPMIDHPDSGMDLLINPTGHFLAATLSRDVEGRRVFATIVSHLLLVRNLTDQQGETLTKRMVLDALRCLGEGPYGSEPSADDREDLLLGVLLAHEAIGTPPPRSVEINLPTPLGTGGIKNDEETRIPLDRAPTGSIKGIVPLSPDGNPKTDPLGITIAAQHLRLDIPRLDAMRRIRLEERVRSRRDLPR